jgi:hypothetical protein
VTGIATIVAEDPLSCAVIGTARRIRGPASPAELAMYPE